MSICISGCVLICLDIHLFCRSACSLFSLSARSSTYLATHLAIWLLVCQFGHLQVCSVACRLQSHPFACSTGQVPIRLFICQSGSQGSIHLPDPQAKSQSVSSSANLAGRAPIWRIFCSFSCNWQHLAAFPFICRIHHLQAEVSSIHLPFRQAVEVHLPNLAGRGPFRSSISLGHCHFRRLNRFQHICVIANLLSRPRANSGQSILTHSSPGINLRHQAVSSPHMLASQALQIPHICFIAWPSPGNSQVPGWRFVSI